MESKKDGKTQKYHSPIVTVVSLFDVLTENIGSFRPESRSVDHVTDLSERAFREMMEFVYTEQVRRMSCSLELLNKKTGISYYFACSQESLQATNFGDSLFQNLLSVLLKNVENVDSSNCLQTILVGTENCDESLQEKGFHYLFGHVELVPTIKLMSGEQQKTVFEQALLACIKKNESLHKELEKASEETEFLLSTVVNFSDRTLLSQIASGFRSQKSFEKAAYLYQKCVDKFQDAVAMIALGDMHKLGQGVPKDFEKARGFFSKASEEGNTDAICRLGLLYLHGEGVEQNSRKAAELFNQAAQGGNLAALMILGRLHEKVKNLQRALEVYQLAFERGEDTAAPAIDRVMNLISQQNSGSKKRKQI